MTTAARPRLIHSVAVGDRHGRVYTDPQSPNVYRVVHCIARKRDQPDTFQPTLADAQADARRWSWMGLEAVRAALQHYAEVEGRAWKANLARLWASGEDWRVPMLRQARNQLGPEWLKQVRTDDLLP